MYHGSKFVNFNFLIVSVPNRVSMSETSVVMPPDQFSRFSRPENTKSSWTVGSETRFWGESQPWLALHRRTRTHLVDRTYGESIWFFKLSQTLFRTNYCNLTRAVRVGNKKNYDSIPNESFFCFFSVKSHCKWIKSIIPVVGMSQFRIVPFAVVFCSSFLLAAKDGEFQKIYFTSIRCNGSEKFVYKNFSCFAKSYSRNFSTINVIGTTKMSLYNINVCQKFYTIQMFINNLQCAGRRHTFLQVWTCVPGSYFHSKSWHLPDDQTSSVETGADKQNGLRPGQVHKSQLSSVDPRVSLQCNSDL